MRKILVGIMFIVAMCFPVMGADNATGWGEGSRITAICTTGVIAYSNVYPLSNFEDIRLLVKVNDSTAAGFGSDSISFEFGYRTGIETKNGSGARDTVWDDLILIDSLLKTQLGTLGSGTCSSDGGMTRTWTGADTLNVAGFAVMSRWFVPEWDGLIRFWVRGLAANKKSARLVLWLEPRQRVGVKGY
jgi:hypothetical protein